MDPQSETLNSAYLSNPPMGNNAFEDFDTDISFNQEDYCKGETMLLHDIFEHIRAGKLAEVQSKLLQTKSFEHYLMLNGAIP